MRRGFRMRTVPGIGRVKVVERSGRDGFIARWSVPCSGCAETPESTSPPERGLGCRECGYTGRRRREMWFPFKEEAA